MGVGSGGHGGAVPLSRTFKHGTNIIDGGLNGLFSAFFFYFFGLFSVAPPPPWKKLNSAIFRHFLVIFSLFSVAPSPSWKIFCRRPCLFISISSTVALVQYISAQSCVKYVTIFVKTQKDKCSAWLQLCKCPLRLCKCPTRPQTYLS